MLVYPFQNSASLHPVSGQPTACLRESQLIYGRVKLVCIVSREKGDLLVRFMIKVVLKVNRHLEDSRCEQISMAGMEALLDNVKCEASSHMLDVKATSMMSTNPLAKASPSAINLECGCVASMGDVLQGGMGGTAQEEDLASFKVVAGTNIVDFVEPDFTERGQHGGPPASTCEKSDQLSGAGKGFCNPLVDSLDLEATNFMMGTQAPKGVQVCAICHEKIKREKLAEIKGCEHSYCVTCILRWATYKMEPWCPQCRLPFSFLYVYRALDGSLSDYLFEESVCLLLRAFWFKPLVVQEPEEQDDYQDDYDAYEEPYYTSNVRLGNRRWGDSGYVRTGRREARPVAVRQVGESGSSSSRQAKGKEPEKESVGRRARRTQKREQLDKMSAKK